MKFRIVNIAATTDLRQPINLQALSVQKGFSYDLNVYHGRCAYLKNHQTRGTVSVFSSGKMISVGTRDYDSAHSDLKYAANRLFAISAAKPTNFKVTIQNIVATCDLGFNLNLEKLSQSLRHIIYDPEQYAAAIYYARNLGGASILLFHNGKVGIAGLRRITQLREVEKELNSLSVWKE